MQVKRNDLRPETARKIDSMPIEELEKILGIKPINTQAQGSQTSKWEKAAEEMANLGISHETSEFFRETVKEFRKDEGG